MTNERIQAMKAIIKTAPSGAAPSGGSVSAGEAVGWVGARLLGLGKKVVTTAVTGVVHGAQNVAEFADNTRTAFKFYAQSPDVAQPETPATPAVQNKSQKKQRVTA